MTFLRDFSEYIITKSGYLREYSDCVTNWVKEYCISDSVNRFFCSHKHRDLLWGPFSLLFKGYMEFFTWGKTAGR